MANINNRENVHQSHQSSDDASVSDLDEFETAWLKQPYDIDDLRDMIITVCIAGGFSTEFADTLFERIRCEG